MNNVEQVLRKVQERVEGRLLGITNVTGVGVGSYDETGDTTLKLVVMLDEESKTTREQVRRLIESEAPGTPIGFLVTGKFSAL